MKQCAILAGVGLVVVISSLVLLPVHAVGAIVVQPGDLSAGDQYRLVFTTSTKRDATSPDISVYNAFVTARANASAQLAALNTTWTAIVSTAATSARANTATDPTPAGPTGVPIYLVSDSIRVANDYDDLWDGSLLANINRTELDTTPPVSGHPYVWTGTETDGTGVSGREMGAGAGAGGNWNWSPSYQYEWIYWVNAGSTSSEWPLYAMSGVLTAVPEPSTLAALGGLLGMGVIGRWWRRRKAASAYA